MTIQVRHNQKSYSCDLAKPIDISIPVGQVKCFYATDFKASPYVAGEFIGSVKAGAPINFFDVVFSPHGNGTHTECFGHITEHQASVNDYLKQFHFVAQLVSVAVEKNEKGDRVLTKEALKTACSDSLPSAIIIRTLPNLPDKLTADYSGNNPPFLSVEAMSFLVENKVQHLLLDLPSVDKESDDGQLLNHRQFWKVAGIAADDNTRKDCTITELIYVPNEVADGLYFLNIQIPSFHLDAVPSKPVLYKMRHLI